MNEKRKTSTLRSGVRSLPIGLWPAADRVSWEEACRPSVRLKRGGAAGQLREVVQHDLARRYGYFLDFLSKLGRLQMSADAAAQVTLDDVQQDVAELKGGVGSVTVYGSIHKLRRFVQLIAPAREIDWLVAIERELATERRPRSKWHRVVHTNVLADAGVTLTEIG